MPEQIRIVIASGKGGTGKTLIATNLAFLLARRGRETAYVDCDVEAPNGHLFLKPIIESETPIEVLSPMRVDAEKCTACRKCSEHCNYNAIAVLKDRAMFFPELCHVCGACTLVCPHDAIIEEQRLIGWLHSGRAGEIVHHHGLLKTGEGGMAVRVIATVKRCAGMGVTVFDAPPGTACPSVEAVRGADAVLLVADPTPFAIHDLKLSVDMCRAIGVEPAVILNRAGLDASALRRYCDEAQLEMVGEIPDSRRIAEVYSGGDLILERLPEFRPQFESLLDRALELAAEKRPVRVKRSAAPAVAAEELRKPPPPRQEGRAPRPDEIVVISGKGGTGKTSLTACFVALAEDKVIADCDVDASDLHLILSPEAKEQGPFSGGYTARIDPEKCVACGQCAEACRFSAIEAFGGVFRVDPLACEGCGVCGLVCPCDAVVLSDAVNGRWFVSDTRHGTMAHAALGIAEENSGRLVTLVRDLACRAAEREGRTRALLDGSPGTGCPVIASLTGSRFALVVTEPTVSGLHDMGRVLDLIRHFNVPAGVVINKCDLNEDMSGRIEAVAREYGADVLGRIPYDGAFTQAQLQRRALVEVSENGGAAEVRRIWRRILDKLAAPEQPAPPE